MANASIPKVMKGLQITKYKKPYLFSTDIPVPQLERKNEILIKIAVAGYCHGDLMIQNSDIQNMPLGATLPMIPSHEGAGIVMAIGSEVTNFKIGDRVGTMAYKNPCGNCVDCQSGMRRVCESLQLCGVTVNGAAAEYMVADGFSTIPIPPSISFEAAAPLMCAGSTIYAGLKRADLQKGQMVAIIGVGGLGHLGIQLAKCMGLRVVAVDVRQAPLDLAKGLKHPPDYVIDATKGIDNAIKELGGEGVDASIIAADANAAFEFGLDLTRKHGTFVAIGLSPEPMLVHYNHLIFRNLTLKGAQLGSPELTKEMVDLVVANDIEVKTRTYLLEDIETLLQDYHKKSRAGKLVMRVSQDE
ncbi:GroES-like protein [Ramaria rubella]|nr:GroES-like protein [Ramaria rubella]